MKKKLLLLLILGSAFIQKGFSQSEHVPGPAEKRITDSLCIALSKLDMSKINDAKGAKNAFLGCFLKQSAMFESVAIERNVSMSDQVAMRQMGEDIAKNLLKEKCDAFLKLATKMAESGTNNDDESTGSSSGNLKRIDLKGFNYIVLTDNNNSEKSFIWLEQFPGSEKFMNGLTTIAGKKVKISWQEIEVYLPSANGYYKVKEIKAIDFL